MLLQVISAFKNHQDYVALFESGNDHPSYKGGITKQRTQNKTKKKKKKKEKKSRKREEEKNKLVNIGQVSQTRIC